MKKKSLFKTETEETSGSTRGNVKRAVTMTGKVKKRMSLWPASCPLKYFPVLILNTL